MRNQGGGPGESGNGGASGASGVRRSAAFIPLEDDFWIAGCLDEEDVERAALAGFDAIINILPEDDGKCRLRDERAQEICSALGLAYRHFPVYGHQLDDRDVCARFAAVAGAIEGRKLVYCRTGHRAAFLWGMASASRLGADMAMARAGKAGHDLSLMEEAIREAQDNPLPVAGLNLEAA
jgi:sulfide:quinone oxidoreductase